MRAYEKYVELSLLMGRVIERGQTNPPAARAPSVGGKFDREHIYYEAEGLFLFEERREASFLGSEIIQHTRSALDHLVYHAAWRDSGVEQDYTQFSIYRKRKDWKGKSAKDLKGIDSCHRLWIEEVQPFRGTTWTRHLADLSNTDKHRIGVDIGIATSMHVDYSTPKVDPCDPQILIAQTKMTAAECQILTGSDRLEVSSLFNQILAGAATIINKFLEEEELPKLQMIGEATLDEFAQVAGKSAKPQSV